VTSLLSAKFMQRFSSDTSFIEQIKDFSIQQLQDEMLELKKEIFIRITDNNKNSFK
jgi:ribosomal protein L29